MKKNGFTLVEVLAIIAILGIMVMIVFPNLNGSTESKKDKELDKLIEIVENAGKAYFSFNNDVYKIPVETLKNENYLTSSLIDPKTNEELDGCVRVIVNNDNIYEYYYSSCETIFVPFSVELNGGTTTQNFESSYNEFTELELVEPEHPTMEFKGWKVVKGNSILKNSKLIIGTTETIIYAVYESLPSLEVDLNGGISNVNYNGNYKSGTIIKLEEPTKEGYTFKGWTIEVGTDAILSGTNLTIGTKNVILTAIWEPLGTRYIMDLLENESILNNGLIVDDTVDQNIRYVGASPNNKVYFNCDDTDANSIAYGGANYDYASSCEVWRIIGVFDTKTSKAGTTKKRIKLINTESTFAASWDSSDDDVNYGHGINQWGPSGEYEGADLMRLLNGYYISSPESICTYCNEQFQSTCKQTCTSESLDNANMKVLTNTAKVMAENVLWNIGAIEWNEDGITPLEAYNAERGSTTGKICTSSGENYDFCDDSVTRTTEWEGKIGLIYLSDYGYASTYEGCANDNSTCNVDNWLHPNADEIWTISPVAGETATWAYRISNTDMIGVGVVGAYIEMYKMKVLPSLYLNENIRIVGGNGNTEPYKLSVQ